MILSRTLSLWRKTLSSKGFGGGVVFLPQLSVYVFLSSNLLICDLYLVFVVRFVVLAQIVQ